jgi:two-component system C4-dicarboxylate transport sensor histidine kinase DctB
VRNQFFRALESTLRLNLLEVLHLSDMPAQPRQDEGFNPAQTRVRVRLWVSGVWILPIVGIAFWILPTSATLRTTLMILAVLAAPLPALLFMIRQRRRLIACAAKAEEEAAQLKLQLDTVRYRTTRLREELQAADRQARLSHQLTLLGQFTAGFMHEFNNPLAIVAGRIEVLLDERKQDAALCADLEQMLKETRYMGNIAGTLLQALRRERAGEIFEASVPQKALEDAIGALRPTAKSQGVMLVEEIAEAPRVDVPEHVIGEVVRGLLSNALQALKGRDDGMIWVRLEPYRTAGARVVARIEDNGPGVPESIREHLFEPFISHSTGRERLGLGLFLAASLLDMYDGRIRYEMRYGGGASFVIELPPARFTRGQPYHWFAGGTTE